MNNIENIIKEDKELKELRPYKDLSSFLQHSFSIENINEFKEYLRYELSNTWCDKILISPIDFAYATTFARLRNLTEEPTQDIVEIFAIIRWMYNNKPIALENSDTYNDFIAKDKRCFLKNKSEQDTKSELKLLTKSLKLDLNKFKIIIGLIEVFPSYSLAILKMWKLVNTVRSDILKIELFRLFKSDEMINAIQILMERFMFNDIKSSELKIEADTANFGFHDFLLNTLSAHSTNTLKTINIIEYSEKVDIEILREENKQLKEKYKQLEKEQYQKIIKEPKENPELRQEEVEVEVNKTYSIDFELSLKQMEDILNGSKFLLLKAEEVDISNILNSVRIENISSVKDDVLKQYYDAVIILIKSIAHSDVARIKSAIGETPIIYTTRTNRRLIIEDIYNQY
jgi:hypothetical protein